MKVVPRMPSWTKSSCRPELAPGVQRRHFGAGAGAARRAVEHAGQRVPIETDRPRSCDATPGRSDSARDLGDADALRCRDSRGGPPATARAAAVLIFSAMRAMSPASSGVRRRPSGCGVRDHVEHPAVSHVHRDRAESRDFHAGIQMRGECGDVAEGDLARPCRRCTSASTAISPAGVSSFSCVTGSITGTMPVSISTVTTQMVLVPDIGGYSDLLHDDEAGVGLGMGGRQDQVAAERPDTRGVRAACAAGGGRHGFRDSTFFSNMVRPGTSRTPPVMTRPGSPQAWASTAVIMLENRMGPPVPAGLGLTSAG